MRTRGKKYNSMKILVMLESTTSSLLLFTNFSRNETDQIQTLDLRFSNSRCPLGVIVVLLHCKNIYPYILSYFIVILLFAIELNTFFNVLKCVKYPIL